MAETSRPSYNGPALRSASSTGRFSSPRCEIVRFSLEMEENSPNRSISHSTGRSQSSKKPAGPVPKRSCMCSPTNHPGSFRCSLHKNNGNTDNKYKTMSYCSNKVRRSAMANSLVRIGGVERVDMVKRSLAALIRPSSHQLRRRENFRRRNSRLSVMSKIES